MAGKCIYVYLDPQGSNTNVKSHKPALACSAQTVHHLGVRWAGDAY